MTIQLGKINPLDLDSRKAIGVRIPFSSNNVFNSTYQTKDAIKVNLLNFLLTGKRERFFNPNFGTDLRNTLFENISLSRIEIIKEQIENEIVLNFPTIIVNNLTIQGIPDNNSIIFYLNYSIKESNIVDQELSISIV
jgi:phage baseplate assembly protein W